MARIRDVMERHAQPRRRTAAGIRAGGSGIVDQVQGRVLTSVAYWDISTWGNGVFGPGGRLVWTDSDWGGGDVFVDESTGHTGLWDFDYFRRCQFGD